MNEIKKDVLPLIFKVMNDAELMLTQLTGMKVKLSIQTGEIILTQSEANKIVLQNLVCAEFGVAWHGLVSPKRLINLVDARKAYCYIACEILKQTLTETGKDLRRDHSSIMYLRDKCSELIEINDPIFLKVQNIKNKLYENIN